MPNDDIYPLRAEEMDRDDDGHLTERGVRQLINWSIGAGLIEGDLLDVD